VVEKLHSAVFMINSLFQRMDRKYLLQVYYAYAHSFMTYGVLHFGGLLRLRSVVFLWRRSVL
jgi:hypothetical protein